MYPWPLELFQKVPKRVGLAQDILFKREVVSIPLRLLRTISLLSCVVPIRCSGIGRIIGICTANTHWVDAEEQKILILRTGA